MNKIVFFIRDISKPGGTERVLIDISNGLVSRGYNITIISLFKAADNFYELDDRIKTIIMYPEVISLRKVYINSIYDLRTLVRKIELDLFITVDTTFSLITAPALFNLKIKKIAWEHFNFNMPKSVAAKISKYLAVLCSKKIIVLTDGDRKLWESKWGTKGKIVKINNMCKFDKTKTIPDFNNKIVLAVGRLVSQKGFDLLIKSWVLIAKELPDWKLLIVGNGEDKKKLEALVIDLSLENKINIVNSTQNIDELYKKATMYCLSSRYEGWGLVLVEAQQYNLPIVSFDCNFGPNEIITDGFNGILVTEGDVNGLSKAIIKIAKEKKVYDRLVSNVVSTDTKKFSTDAVISKWDEMIKSL